MSSQIWHAEAVGGGVPDECTCPRQGCGGVIDRKGMFHRAESCAEIQRKRAIRIAGRLAARTITKPKGKTT